MKNSGHDMFSDKKKNEHLASLKSWVKRLKDKNGSPDLIKDIEKEIRNLEGETGTLPLDNPYHGSRGYKPRKYKISGPVKNPKNDFYMNEYFNQKTKTWERGKTWAKKINAIKDAKALLDGNITTVNVMKFPGHTPITSFDFYWNEKDKKYIIREVEVYTVSESYFIKKNPNYIKLKDALASNKIEKHFGNWEVKNRLTGNPVYFESPIKALKFLNEQLNLVLEKSPADIYWMKLPDDIKRKYRHDIYEPGNENYKDAGDLAYQTKKYEVKKNPSKYTALKQEYICSVYQYILNKDPFDKQGAYDAEKSLKKMMTKQEFKAFIKKFKVVIQAGIKRGRAYMKSKPYLTMLNSLDKTSNTDYTLNEKRNPGKQAGADISNNKAKDLFKRFHHYPADKSKQVTIAIPGLSGKLDVMHLGKMPKLWYTSDKDINDSGSREKFTYVHGLKPHLDIYVDPDKTVMIIPLDGQDITERGLLAKPGKRVQK